MENTHTYIVDTSVILDNAYNIFQLSQNGKNRVIIAETVLDEIDAKKSGYEEINFQAREFNRIMEESESMEEIREGEGEKQINIVRVKVGEAVIDLVTKPSYKTNVRNDALNIINDRKILEVAHHFAELDAEVVSNDSAMRIRARSLGMKSTPLKMNRVDDIDALSFIETVSITQEQKALIETSKPEDFGKEFSYYTNVEFIVQESGEHILAFYKPVGFRIIDENRLRRLTVKPRNKEQIFFLNMLIDPDLPIVVCAGVTGSGKNILSLQGAITSYEQSEDMEAIRYCRNTVTAGDPQAQLGFLKGDEGAKLSVFTYPLHDAVADFMRMEYDDKLKNGKSVPLMTNEEFMKKYDISIVNINQMRGTNLSGYMIFDEWQNASAAVNKLMLTRVTEGSKVVILGDLNQIDHPHLSRFNNALSIMLKHAKTSNLIGAIKMSRVMRGRIAEFADQEL